MSGLINFVDLPWFTLNYHQLKQDMVYKLIILGHYSKNAKTCKTHYLVVLNNGVGLKITHGGGRAIVLFKQSIKELEEMINDTIQFPQV